MNKHEEILKQHIEYFTHQDQPEFAADMESVLAELQRRDGVMQEITEATDISECKMLARRSLSMNRYLNAGELWITDNRYPKGGE